MNLSESLEFDIKEILQETEKAWQIVFDTGEIHWLPKSQCRIIGDKIYIPKWLCEQKGLEELK